MAGKKPLLGGIEDYDRMAALDSSLHRRDPRAKLIVALLAVVAPPARCKALSSETISR